ncbi:MAG: response regulator transcription factor, partial [Porcipelethomonas sp.]
MNIIVVDDDNLVAISLKTILEASGQVTVLAIGSSGEEAIELYEKHTPDVLLMDIRMNGMTGIEAGEIILKKHPDAKILYLTTFSDDEYIVQALKIGTKGYILKQNFECIVPALKTVMEGQTVFGDDVITRLPTLMSHSSGIDYEKYGISEK